MRRKRRDDADVDRRIEVEFAAGGAAVDGGRGSRALVRPTGVGGDERLLEGREDIERLLKRGLDAQRAGDPALLGLLDGLRVGAELRPRRALPAVRGAGLGHREVDRGIDRVGAAREEGAHRCARDFIGCAAVRAHGAKCTLRA